MNIEYVYASSIHFIKLIFRPIDNAALQSVNIEEEKMLLLRKMNELTKTR